MSKPWLTTARLLLRRPGPHDARHVFAVHSDSRTYRHDPSGRMQAPREAESLVVAWTSHWEAHDFGYAVVETTAEHCVIGFAGAKHQHVAGHDVLSLYYRFAPEAWGHGYATEAVTAVVNDMSTRLPTVPVLARVATKNPASIRVAERVGLERQALIDPRHPAPHLLLASMRLAAQA